MGWKNWKRIATPFYASSFMRGHWPLCISTTMTNSTQEIILNAKVAKTMSNHSLQTTTVASGVVGTPAAMKYRETPYTWDGVVDIIERNQDLSLL
eukprot:9421344-Ditylum_brightwellii.AAC.1